MVILHTETLRHWGGQQNRIILEATGLSKRGHTVIIACRKGSVLARKAQEAGIKVYEVNMVKQAHLSTVPELTGIIKKEGVDIVSTHSSTDSWAGGIAAKLAGRPLVRFRHNLIPVGRGLLARFIYAIPDKLVAVSTTVEDVMTEKGINSKRIMVIPDSVDIGKFNPAVESLRKELNISPETVIIGNTSSFTEVKGQESFLEAFNSIHEQCPCILLFAGRLDEPFRGRYLSLVKEELRDRVIFLGHRDDIPSVLKTFDIFVFPSLVEGLGTALLEAMVMGVPVAVSDIPTFRDLIKEGENGVSFRVNNPEDMAEKVLYLMKNRDMRQQLGRNARTTALERFTLDTMLDKTLDLYNEVVHGR